MGEVVYVGTYTSGSTADEGVEVYLFEEEPLSLSKVMVASIDNPSYLCFDRSKKYLFGVVESSDFGGTSGGAVAAFSLEDGGIRIVDTKPNYGNGPCHVTVDKSGKFVYTANYGEGTISEFKFTDGELYLVKTRSHYGKSVNPTRQEAPHMHSVTFTSDEKYLCAADLGLDKVVLYKFDSELGLHSLDNKITIDMVEGSGPRHVVFNECVKCLYVLNELSSTVDVFSYDDEYDFIIKQTISSLPNNFQKESSAAAIKMSCDGKFLYASNRGDDSIAVFKINTDGTLALTSITSTHGKHPRDFAITKSGKYILVANTHSNNISVFIRNGETGEIIFSGLSAYISNPVCVLI